MLRPLAAVVAAVLLFAAPASAHKADPNYLTRVDRIEPSTNGITVDVINRSDQLELHNQSDRDVVIGGYNDEPYARVTADGTVSVNTRSPAYYLNQDRYGEVDVPDGIDGQGTPKWKVLDKTGRFEWHDHRMHWMAKSTPPQVKDKAKRTTIFTWKVPLTVGDKKGDIAGTLFWTPDPKAPIGLIVAIGVLMVGLCVFAVVVRRRRGSGPREARPDAW